jgi:hypothetical protein
MMEDDLRAALQTDEQPSPGFEARTTAGVHARWRRRTQKWRNAAAFAVAATTVFIVVARAGIHKTAAPVPRQPPKAQGCDTFDDDDLVAFANLDHALEQRADWDRALAPLRAYRDLADLGDLP